MAVALAIIAVAALFAPDVVALIIALIVVLRERLTCASDLTVVSIKTIEIRLQSRNPVFPKNRVSEILGFLRYRHFFL